MSPSKGPRKRLRLDAATARRRILDVAEKRLIEGGPEAVRVQVIAKSLGITDAAVHHHFRSRQGLLEALLRRAGHSMAEETERILSSWDGDPASLHRVAELIAETYAERGFARLALWLSFQGWRSRGGGMFVPLVDALHTTRLRIARERGAAAARGPVDGRRDGAHPLELGRRSGEPAPGCRAHR